MDTREQVTTTHVTVTVSEEDTHPISWMVLWVGYFLATIACAVQVYLDRKKQLATEAAAGAANNNRGASEGSESSGGYSTRCVVSVLTLQYDVYIHCRATVKEV
jgi:hypothetical protein